MSTTYTTIPYPTLAVRRDSETRRGSLSLIASERRGSTTGMAIVNNSISLENRDREKSSGNRVEFSGQEALLPQRVNEFDMDMQRLRIYDQRKNPSAQYFEDSNGGAYSPYLTYRMQRILEEYNSAKLEEKKFLNSVQYDRDNSIVPGMQGFNQSGRKNVLPYGNGNGCFGEYLQQSSNLYNGPVEQVEWFPRDNAREHRTDKYSTVNMVPPFRSNPVFRRGQPFFMALKLSSRTVDLSRQPLTIVFNFGSYTSCGKLTRVVLPVTGDREFTQRDKNEWDIRLHNLEGNTLTLQIHVPPTALVGAWQYEIHYQNDVLYGREDIYVIFNPYCSEDPVFVDNEQFRREYIHSEAGKLYRGTNKVQKSYKWVYGQFEANILAITVLLLDRYTEGNKDVIDFNQRGNPAFVARALAKMMFSRLSGPFRNSSLQNGDTTSYKSYTYTGSQSVLDRLIENRFQPLDIDNQSYVVSALYVTFCRALGIPCRSVTSYRVPQNKTTLSVDQYWGYPDDDTSANDLYDSYHCFNDVYIRRDDVITSTAFVGWQAIDAYNVGRGPAPAEAIRRGEIGVNFDVFYFYSMFNSQVRHYCGNNYPSYTVKDDMGRLIVTKKCDRDDDDDDFEDITHLYKKTDGTDDEKQGVMNAMRGMGSRRCSSIRNQQELLGCGTDDLIVDWLPNTAAYGQNLQVSLALQNVANEIRTLVINFFARPLYGGVVGRKIKQYRRQVTLQPLQRETLGIDLSLQDYQDRLDDEYTVRFFATIYVKETQQFWAGDEDVALSSPKINIQVRGLAQVDNDCQVNFSMVNPLTVALTDCYLFYEAAGLTKPVYRRLPDIKPGEMLNVNEQVVPRKAGDSRLVAVFNSRQLRQAMGSKVFAVRG